MALPPAAGTSCWAAKHPESGNAGALAAGAAAAAARCGRTLLGCRQHCSACCAVTRHRRCPCLRYRNCSSSLWPREHQWCGCRSCIQVRRGVAAGHVELRQLALCRGMPCMLLPPPLRLFGNRSMPHACRRQALTWAFQRAAIMLAATLPRLNAIHCKEPTWHMRAGEILRPMHATVA